MDEISHDSVFLQWVLTSFEHYIWFRLANHLGRLIKPYEMNDCVNSLYLSIKNMDKDIKTGIVESVYSCFNTIDRDEHFDNIVKKIGEDSLSKQDVFATIYQVSYIMRLFYSYQEEDKARSFLLQIKKQLIKRYLKACSRELINPIYFLAYQLYS